MFLNKVNEEKMFRLGFSLAKFKFKLRNEGSYLGIVWYLLNPLLLFTLLFFIFHDRIGNNIPQYPLYLLIGIVMYNFFQSTTSEAARVLLDNRNLIKSIKVHYESFIISGILHTLFSHFFEILALGIFFIISGINPIWLLIYPAVLLFFCMFIYGVSLILSSLTVYLIDLGNIWDFLTKLLWFATPIFYEIGGQNRLFILNLFNPLYYFITLTRDILIYNKIPELWIVLGAIEYSLISLIAGLIIFKKLKKKFAENV